MVPVVVADATERVDPIVAVPEMETAVIVGGARYRITTTPAEPEPAVAFELSLKSLNPPPPPPLPELFTGFPVTPDP
jgi:hypothetical protein